MKSKNTTTEIKVGDWVSVLIVGFKMDNDPAYQVESIEDGQYTCVQTEGSYQHRVTVEERKLKRL